MVERTGRIGTGSVERRRWTPRRGRWRGRGTTCRQLPDKGTKPKCRRDLAGKPWTSLVEYALGCVEGESAQTLVPVETSPDDDPWFSHDGAEMLVTGRADSTKASPAIAEYLDRTKGSTDGRRRSLIYGWPTIVTRGRSGPGSGPPRRQITPLFVVRIEKTKGDGGWKLTTTHEPEFNLAALANRPENADTADEVRKLALPFGDPEGIARMAAEAARLLGYSPPVLDPDQLVRLDRTTAGKEEVYNAAIFLAAEFSPYRYMVDRELRELSRRDDWEGTAAAWLAGKGRRAGRKTSEPLVAALQTNQSQEEILASIRTEPLTVVTGPPGTGKTQLVVNAVANAWLDGETVMVASTNNAAVDIAVERADRDVLPGLLIRTGHRDIKQQVAQSISTARANARRYAGPRKEAAGRLLARAGKQRSVRRAKLDRIENVDRWLLAKAQERSEARSKLLETTNRLRQAGDGRRTEDETPSLEEVRTRARAAGAELKRAYERQEAAAPFVPKKPRPCRLRSRGGFGAEEIERIRSRAETLVGSGPFSFFERKKLREHVGCPRGTPMEGIHEWARAWQEAAAERLREEEDARTREELAQRVAAAGRGLAEALGGENGGSPVEELLAWARTEHRLTEIEEEFESLRKDREKLKEQIGDAGTALEEDREWSRRSLTAVQAKVAERIAAAPAGALPAFSSVSMHGAPFGKAVEKALGVFPGWACTALSAGGSFPLKAGLFDLVIVDEASQCSLADILPLAYRAKRIVIAGDPNQLRAITVVGDAQLRKLALETGHDEDDLRERGLHHKDGSAYEAFEYAADSPPRLLDEHYRCHPHIAKWFNETFYGGELDVLTDIAKGAGKRALVWRDVTGDSRRPRRRGGWVNEAQARATVELLEELIEPEMTTGVVAPYAAQSELIEHLARRKIGEDLLAETGFVCGTAHKLQGAERDLVIFTSTLTPNMPLGAAAWIEQERNLMNVAVSRARRMLVVVGHPDLDPERSRTLASLREHILAVESAGGPGGSRAAPVHVHSDAERLLLEAMRQQGLAPLGKVDVEGFELDFALMDGLAMLDVEVDGDHHLDIRRQQRRNDVARDEILGSLGWKVLRIPAWRCHDGPDEAADEVGSTWERLLALGKPRPAGRQTDGEG